jgi:hypothetical protein
VSTPYWKNNEAVKFDMDVAGILIPSRKDGGPAQERMVS